MDTVNKDGGIQNESNAEAFDDNGSVSVGGRQGPQKAQDSIPPHQIHQTEGTIKPDQNEQKIDNLLKLITMRRGEAGHLRVSTGSDEEDKTDQPRMSQPQSPKELLVSDDSAQAKEILKDSQGKGMTETDQVAELAFQGKVASLTENFKTFQRLDSPNAHMASSGAITQTVLEGESSRQNSEKDKHFAKKSQPFLSEVPCLEKKNMLTRHTLNSPPKSNVPALSPPSRTVDDRMNHDTEQQIQMKLQCISTQLSKRTNEAKSHPAQATSSITLKRDEPDHVEKNDEARVKYQNLPRKSFQRPTQTLQLLQASEVVVNDDEDNQDDPPQKLDVEMRQFNSSAMLGPLYYKADGQASTLQPPFTDQKRIEGNLMEPKQTDQTTTNQQLMNTSEATIGGDIECSDIEAGQMLLNIMKKRKPKHKITLNDINEAILQGKPNPPMVSDIEKASRGSPKFKEQTSQVENTVGRQEDDGVTQKKSWITGSHDLKEYLCWPCLLFGESIWSISTEEGLHSNIEAIQHHQTTVPHLSAFITLLIQEAMLKREKEAKSEKDLEYKKQFQLLLMLLIEIICSNVKASLEEHADMLALACSYKENLQIFIKEKPSDFLFGFVASNIRGTTRAIERLLMEKILEEVKTAPFVTILFEDTNNFVDKSLMAVILRYVTDSGHSKERFVKLVKMGVSRAVADFLKIIDSVVQEYELKEKLVGFTYSGTVIAPREILVLNKTVSRIYPRAKFFPYQEHNFKKITIQSLSHLPECRSFFHTVYEFGKFVKNDPVFKENLMAFDKANLRTTSKPWNFDNDFVTSLKYHYKTLKVFLCHIMEQESTWNPETVAQVECFSRFLGSQHCRVMILTISAVLEAINDMSTVTEGGMDRAWISWNRSLSKATSALTNQKTGGLSSILHENNTLINDSERAEIHSPVTTKLFKQIIETSLIVINHRYVDLEWVFVRPSDINAVSNDDPKRLAAFLKRIDVKPEDFSELKNEAKSCYENQLLADQNLEQAITNLSNDSDKVAFPRLLRFLRLCLTLPTKEAYSGNSTPAIHRLHSYMAKHKLPKFFDLLTFMEKDLLSSVQREEQFYDRVIDYCMQLRE